MMPAKRNNKELWVNPDAFATSLTILALDKLGTDMIQWHPTTIHHEIVDEFNVRPPKHNMDKLFAGVGLLANDDFYTRLPIFVQYCNILSGGEMNPQRLDLADADECAWGITEAVLLSPPENEDNPFSEEIQYYIGGVLNNEGIVNPPDVLRIGKWDTDNSFGELSSQDETMFLMEYDSQTRETEAIKSMLRTRLQNMMHEISSLSLENGKTESLLDMLTNKR